MEDRKTEVFTTKQTGKQLFWEIIRFLLVGGLATLADYLCFYLVRAWIFPASLFSSEGWKFFSLAIATAIGFCVGLLVNWVLSVSFVYRSVKNKEQASSKKSFALFTLIGVMGLILTELGVLILVRILPDVLLFNRAEWLGLPWAEWLAKVIMTCIVLVFNYLGRKLFIFKS